MLWKHQQSDILLGLLLFFVVKHACSPSQTDHAVFPEHLLCTPLPGAKHLIIKGVNPQSFQGGY